MKNDTTTEGPIDTAPIVGSVNSLDHPASSLANYRRYLKDRRCWVDGTPTHASSEQQRQCPKCRLKWSFDNLTREMQLLEEFCLKQSASKAAGKLGCSKNTAIVHYRVFCRHMEEVIAKMIIAHEIALTPITSKELKSLEHALNGGREKQRFNACKHLFFISLGVEERMDLIFKSLIAPAVKRKARKATVARLRPVRSLAAFSRPAHPRRTPASNVPELCLGMGGRWAKVWLALTRKSRGPRK